MDSGKLVGYIHRYYDVNGVELLKTEPLQISCSPAQFNTTSNVLEYADNEFDAAGHLHRDIIAPKKNIVIYDLDTGLPAEQVNFKPI